MNLTLERSLGRYNVAPPQGNVCSDAGVKLLLKGCGSPSCPVAIYGFHCHAKSWFCACNDYCYCIL